MFYLGHLETKDFVVLLGVLNFLGDKFNESTGLEAQENERTERCDHVISQKFYLVTSWNSTWHFYCFF